MKSKNTHREVKTPKIAGRFLADYMSASERRRRSIVRACKYRAIARVIQHDHARSAISRSYYDPDYGRRELGERVEQLRSTIEPNPFDRDVLDHNADYIAKFCTGWEELHLPDFLTISPSGKSAGIDLEGVVVSPEIAFRVERVTKTNKCRVGAGTLRYSKSGPLKPEEAAWQASFLHGYLARTVSEVGVEPEGKLCLVIDSYAGKKYSAPGDAVTRFNDMRAACASIAERWDNVLPPPKAIF